MEVFPHRGENWNIQLCQSDRILAVGGGSPDDQSSVGDDLSNVKPHEWGFGLAFGADLQFGTSSPCVAFQSPALSTLHGDGSKFEVANLEIWTLTPASTLEEANRLEEGMASRMTGRAMTI